jgi:glycosyltransferase involved in cell wall biosynthesis
MREISNPMFSVIVATHLRPIQLRRALCSLRNQQFQEFEVIVVADELDSESAVVISELLTERDCFIKRRGANGPAISRNLGLDMARGDWVLFLDDDDSFLPHHLEAIHGHIRKSVADVVFTDCEVVSEDRSKPQQISMSGVKLDFLGQGTDELWIKNFIPLHALAYRRSVLDGCRFDSHLRSLEDWDFLLSVASKSTPLAVPGGGAVMYKDYVNSGNRRGTQEDSSNSFVVLDYLYIYRRWPAPRLDLKARRKELLMTVGLDVPVDWL